MFPWSWEGSFGCWLTLIFSLHHLVVPSLHGSTDQSTFLLKEHPSVRRARPPVGWHSTAEHELHTTTVCECEKTVVIVKQPWHLTSMKNEFGLCTNLFFLCFCFSNSCSWVRWGFCVSFPGTCGHFRSYRLDVLHVRSFYVWVRSLVFRPMGLVSDVDRVGMGFWFLFFFRFPLLLLLSLCFVPSIVLASDHRVSTTFIRRFRSIVSFFFFPTPTTGPFDGPIHGFRVPRVCGWFPSFLPSFLRSFFVSTHLGWVQQIDVRLEHHGDVGLAWSDDVRASALPHLRRRSPSPSHRRERTDLRPPSHPQAQPERGREEGVAAQGGRELSDRV